ncbi:uncharacterized protein LOC126834088 [Adelges cooleyi]|uniref:uncharacterized protein LOC126834088 n=1 Tax=Adelges cooleyi TaxID=133065 RepID=UPI0021806019|nr:uncharacterized protein LOC126834088 [Adelges cooleyi]
MSLKFTVLKTALFAVLLASNTMARPDAPLPSATLSSAAAVSKIQETLNESLSLARAKNDHAGGNRLSIAHLLLIIGKVLAPIVGAIVEPLLVNIAKGITWAITYSLATGFAKPLSYEHFVPVLGHEHDLKKPVAYSSVKELPQLDVLALTNALVEGVEDSEREPTVENAERKLTGLLMGSTAMNFK